MVDPRFPTSGSDSSKPFITGTLIKGDQGFPALYVIVQTPTVAIPCDNDGGNPVVAGAISEVHVMKAGALQTGWNLAYDSGLNCTGAVNNGPEPGECYIASVSGAYGYADFTATKAGEVTQGFRMHFTKVPEGATGATGAKGDDGDAGDAGSTGATGSDGTGVVVVS